MFESKDLASYGQDAFAFIEDLDRMQTPAQLMDGMSVALARFGCTRFSFFDVVRADEALNDRVWAYRASAEWLKLYLDNSYVHHDPAIRQLRSATYPFQYGDAAFDPESEPRAAEIMLRAREYQITGGVMVPVPRHAGCRGGVWFGSEQSELSPQSGPVLHLLGLYAFYRIRAMVAPIKKPGVDLTVREREVLTWTAHGKSAWEIGEILGIAERTVNEHAQTAAHKLGASNRTQTVALALRDKLIAL